MKIKWLGQSTFKIQSSSNLVMDPYGPKIGELPSDLSADVVTVSHQHFDHNYTEGVSGNPQIIDESGEFSIKGFEIKGVKSFHDNESGKQRGDNIIYRVSAEGITLCHMGDLGHILTPEQIDEIGNVDVLMIPVGGHYTIDAVTAVQVVHQLNPKIVLPMHYKPENSLLQLPIEGVNKFNELIGWKLVEQTDELEINKSDLNSIDNEVVVFKK
jgi:L-ascorbate metabolism protein UlaG (beta-lactamase superfamily)